MRQLFAVAAAGALAVTLSGCAATAPEVTKSLSMPAEVPETPQPSPLDSSPAATAPGQEADAAGVAMEDCLVVAAAVSSVQLAPLSFMGKEDPETMAKLKEQLDHLQGKVPDELKPHFARVGDAAAGGPDGPGNLDEPAFREALAPVRHWLEDHCNEPVR